MDSYGFYAYLALAGLAIIQALAVALNVYEHRRRAMVRLGRPIQKRPAGRALVLAPCKGRDPGLEENIRALLTQDYPDYEVTFIVEDLSDPACPVIRRMIAEHRQITARLLVAGRATHCAQKVHNLRMATANIGPEISHLAFFDSDGLPKPCWLRAATYKHWVPGIGATTGYRWLVPERPTLANNLVCAINCNVLALLSRDSYHMVWGGSWALRREVFEQIGLHDAWQGTLSDDLVASRQLRRAALRVRFDPACMLTSMVDLSWPQMFAFVRRQYLITRHYAFPMWLLAISASTIRSLAWTASLILLFGAQHGGAMQSWLPAAVLGLLYSMSIYRGWAVQSLAAVYSPEKLNNLRGVRRWDIWGGPLVAVVQWLGLIASAFGHCVLWRGISYRLDNHGQVADIQAPESLASQAIMVIPRRRVPFSERTPRDSDSSRPVPVHSVPLHSVPVHNSLNPEP